MTPTTHEPVSPPEAGTPPRFVLTAEHVRWLGDLVWTDAPEPVWGPWFAPDFKAYLPGWPVLAGGPAFVEITKQVRRAKPDVSIEWHSVLVDGDVAALRVTFRGHQTGDLFGIPPTGKLLTIGEHILERYDSQGRMTEFRQEADYQGMLTQIGVLPPPGTGPLGQVVHAVATAVRMSLLRRLHARGRSPR